MMQRLKSFISDTLLRCGLEVRRSSSIPFGVHWHKDILFFPNGDKLETILDVGANTGQTALAIVRHFSDTRVYSFEPVPSTFKELTAHVAKFPQIEVFCCALGADQGSAKMTTEILSETNTLILDADTHSRTESLVEVPVDTVDNFCATKGIQRINLLKIDTEGYEMNVLRGAQRMLDQKRVDFILAECAFFHRNGAPHGDFSEILQYASGKGFNVVAFYTGGVDNLGWMWGDVLLRHTSTLHAGRVSASPIGRNP